MTGRQIADRVAGKLGIRKKESQAVLRTFFSSVVEECLTAPRLEIRGFGTFSAVRRKPRPGMDFKTGRRITVPDRLVLKFKPARSLLENLNPPPKPLPTLF